MLNQAEKLGAKIKSKTSFIRFICNDTVKIIVGKGYMFCMMYLNRLKNYSRNGIVCNQVEPGPKHCKVMQNVKIIQSTTDLE